jgi:mRNA interferase MazF
MKRGEVWVVRGHGYGSKPRPAIVIQSDSVVSSSSFSVIPLTTSPGALGASRVALLINEGDSGRLSFAMVDKVMPIKNVNFARKVAVIEGQQMINIERQLIEHLGIMKDAA